MLPALPHQGGISPAGTTVRHAGSLSMAKQPTFTCATGPSQPEKPASSDAALPFVSSLAGLQLATALLQLRESGPLLGSPHNQWQLDLTLPAEAWLASRHPRTRCEHVVSSETRARIYEMQPRRWDRRR